MSAVKAISLVVIVAVFGIVAAIGLPIAVNQLSGNTSTTIAQDVGTLEEVNADLNSTLNSVDTSGSPDNATYKLNTSNEDITKTIDNGSEATYSFEEGDVTVNVSDVNSGSPGNSTAKFTYPRDFAYSDSARALWGILGLALILAAFLYILSVGLRATNRL